MINICFSSDNNYAIHLAVSMVSILKNLKKEEEVSFYILDGGISDENKNKIANLKKIKKFNIEYFKIDESRFDNCHMENCHISIQTYYRFIIPEIFPNIDKILYLDCDIIVKQSLAPLYNEDISSYWIAGVEDIGYYFHRRLLKRETQTFYVNAGVLLINISKWRTDNITDLLFDFTYKNTTKLIHMDQDVINMCLNSKSKPLPLKWNVQDSFYDNYTKLNHPKKKCIKEAKNDIGIIHYTGKAKPWNDDTVHLAGEYYKYKLFFKDNHFATLKKLFSFYVLGFYKTQKHWNIRIFGKIKTKLFKLKKI